MEFSNALKNLRIEKKLSQRELAKFLNLSSGTIGMYETGKREPDYATLEKISNFFNVSTDYLLGRTEIRHLNSQDYSSDTIVYENDNTPTDDNIDFAKHFQKLRLSSGFESIDDLAKAADVWSFTIKRIESGKSKMPSPSILEKLAKPLGISPEELIEAAGYAIVEHGYVKAYDDNFKGTRFSNLTQEEQKNILDQIEFYESRRAEKSKPQ